MALSKRFGLERQVPFYFLVMGGILVCFFVITFWFLGPSSNMLPGNSPLNESGYPSETKRKDPTKYETFELSTHDGIKFAKGPGKNDSKDKFEEENLGKGNEEGDIAEDNLERKPADKDSKIRDEFESEDRNGQDTIEEDEPEGRGEKKSMEGKNAIDTEKEQKRDSGKLGDKDAIEADKSRGKEGREDAVPSDQKVDDGASPGITAAAELELTTENREIPKHWTTQVRESNEETKLVKSFNETNEDVLKMEGKEFEHHEKNGTEPIDNVKGNRSEHPPGEVSEGEKLENRKRTEEVQEMSVKQPAVEGQGNGTNVDGRGQEDKAEEFKANATREAAIVDHAWNSRSEHLQGEQNKGEQLKDQNGTGQAPEKSDGQSAVEVENAGKSLAYDWNLCNWQAAEDNIPCLDNKEAIRKLPSRRRFEHRERHCPSADKFPMCLVPVPKGYRLPIRWPRSRNEIWFNNVPHPKLVSYKKEQNWVNLEGDKLVFPGGGTQFKFGASKYIDNVEEFVADVAWGKHTRVVLDIGCGVASFGGYLFDRDVLTMSFAPKDEHEAQVQLALERGIPAISAVMGTQRLPFPSNGFDLVHCARCRIHWHGDGGKWLLEVNRVLRPGGYFVWSATPVYRSQTEDKDFWKAMVKLTEAMCWKLVSKIKGLSSGVGFAIYQKPTSNYCYEERDENYPPICSEKENPDAAWYTLLENCLQKIPTEKAIHGAEWPPAFPERLHSIPGWLNHSEKSLFGQHAAAEFQMDTEHWTRVIMKSYLKGLGIDWASIRNVMDMKAGYGGFAAALLRQSLWVLNVVPIDEPDTLPVIFDRGLFGIYHNWCESFSTYPRTYDLLHVDHLFKRLVLSCKPLYTLLEMDRILRPEGWVIFREKSTTLTELLPIIESLHWDVRLSFVEGEEELLVAQKSYWRPQSSEVLSE